jgi:hypothetical protein
MKAGQRKLTELRGQAWEARARSNAAAERSRKAKGWKADWWAFVAAWHEMWADECDARAVKLRRKLERSR